MGNKEYLIVCTDDIRPSTIKKYWQYWELLRNLYPELKLNAFVVPYWFEESAEHIHNKEFIDWYESVKGWVQLHLHGFAHTFPPECTLEKEEQEKLIEKGSQLLKKICKQDFGYKAPGYHYIGATLDVLKKYHIKFLCNEKEIIWLNDVEPKRELSLITLVQTHTNGISADCIHFIYDDLSEFFKNKEFLFLNDLIT